MLSFYRQKYSLNNDAVVLKSLVFLLSCNYAEHGGEYPCSYDNGVDPTKFPVLKDLTWQNKEFQFAASYEIYNSIRCFMQYLNSQRNGDVLYEPPVMTGNTNTLVTGVYLGL